jgi:hypothetical protein
MNSRSTYDNKVYSTNFIGGIYASHLTRAFTSLDGASASTDDYKKTDYGIVLGIEQDRYLTKNIVITPGIKYNQGIANITASSSPFNSAKNLSFEFNLGVKYLFFVKKDKNTTILSSKTF